MLVSDLDREVEEIVNILNESGMQSYASCDGTLKTHFDESNQNAKSVPSSGYIAMMEADKVRDLFAILQEDEILQKV